MDAAIRQVMFPVLSRAHDEKEKFIDIMRRMSKLGSFVIFPVMFGLSAVAKPLILLLLKEQWLLLLKGLQKCEQHQPVVDCLNRFQR